MRGQPRQLRMREMAAVEPRLVRLPVERLAQGRLDEPDFAPAREDIVERFEARSVPTLRSLLGLLRESENCAIYACSGSMAIGGLAPELVERSVGQMIGWTTILELTAGVTDRFYL